MVLTLPLAGVLLLGRIETSTPIAQLAEHLTLNQRVLGSSPSGGTDVLQTANRRYQSPATAFFLCGFSH